MISLIIPVYNAEDYITDTLDSILRQTIQSYEIILVNDGSTDRTVDTVEHYILLHPHIRILLLEQENLGPAAARNRGLQYVNGDFISFVDADDILCPSYLETLLEGFSDEVDFVFGKYLKITDGHKEHPTVLENEFYGISDAETVFVSFISSRSYISLWNAMFKARIIREHCLVFRPELRIGEDFNFISRYLIHCRSVNIINRIIYTFQYDSIRCAAREEKWCPVSLGQSCFADLPDNLQQCGWATGLEALITGRLPVFSLLTLITLARKSSSFKVFREQLSGSSQSLLKSVPHLRRRYLKAKTYLMSLILALILRVSPRMFYTLFRHI